MPFMAVPEQHVDDPLAKLSAREREVLELAARGLTNAQVARQLHLSTHAVKFHLASVYRNLDVLNRTHAAARYVQLLRGDIRLLADNADVLSNNAGLVQMRVDG